MSDLTELMRRDPFKCSRQDIEQIIKFYREKHQTYNTAPSSGRTGISGVVWNPAGSG